MKRRMERIGKLMQHAIGQILMRNMSDPRIDVARTSVTRVVVQEDLLRAKVYISVLGEEADQAKALAALTHAAGRIQILLRSDVQLRTMPVLEFLIDEQFKGTLKTYSIIQRAMQEIRDKEESAAGAAEDAAPATGDEDDLDEPADDSPPAEKDEDEHEE
jgi:ribosome-binding factor A